MDLLQGRDDVAEVFFVFVREFGIFGQRHGVLGDQMRVSSSG